MVFQIDIDEEIPLIIEKEKQFLFESYKQGYNSYVDLWTSKVEDDSLN